MVLLDTHALLWWTLDPGRLSPKASSACSKILQTGSLISSISIWEIGIKIKNGRIDIGMAIEDYTRKLNQLNCVEIVPVDEKIWMESIRLRWENRDPADRVIVATALFRSVPIVSKDEKISSFYGKTLW